MQGIGFEGFAGETARHAGNGAGAVPVNHQHDGEQGDRQRPRPQGGRAKKDALERFPDDVGGGDQEKRSFDEGGEILKLCMAVGVISVGGLVGNAD